MCARALLVAIGVAFPLWAQVHPIDQALGKVRDLLDRGKWADASLALDGLLKANEGNDELRIRRAELEFLAERQAFGAKYPLPELKDVISGELMSFAPSGKIKLRYVREKDGAMKDWIRGADGGWIHPMAFKGPHSIRVRGGRYPGGSGLIIMSCLGDNDGLVVGFGREQESDGGTANWVPPRLVRLQGREVLDTKTMSSCQSGKKFDVSVRVEKTSVAGHYNGKAVVSGKKPPDLWGVASLSSGFEFDEVVLEGDAEPSWVQEQLSLEVARQRDAFRKDWKVQDSLPAWVFEPCAKPAGLAVRGKVEGDDAWPGKIERSHRPALAQVISLLERGRMTEGIAFVEGLSERQMSPAAKALCLARFHMELGRAQAALTHVEQLRSLAPDYQPARDMQVELLLQLGRHDEGIVLLQEAATAHPGSPEPQVELATVQLRLGRLSDAQTSVRASLARGVVSKELLQLDTTVVRATEGPPWRKRFEYRSPNYLVLSDIDRETCIAASKILEESLLAYTVSLDRPPPSKDPYVVCLFSGESGYHSWCESLFDHAPSHTAGLYYPALKQLYIWNLPDRKAMLRTVRHEGLHQYLDRVMSDPPRWFNEGLAEYYETAEMVGGRWRLGAKRPDHLPKILDASQVKDFMFGGDRAFFADVSKGYATGWALVHFCRHGPAEFRPLFDSFWKAFKEHPDNGAALDLATKDLDWKAFERAFKRHCLSLGE